jgi:hypothetical protein
LGKQGVFGQSITFTLSRPTAVGLRRGWLGGTLACDDVCVGDPELALRNIVAAGLGRSYQGRPLIIVPARNFLGSAHSLGEAIATDLPRRIGREAHTRPV